MGHDLGIQRSHTPARPAADAGLDTYSLVWSSSVMSSCTHAHSASEPFVGRQRDFTLLIVTTTTAALSPSSVSAAWVPALATHPLLAAGEYGELLFEPSAREPQAGEAQGILPSTRQDLLKLLDQALSRPFLPPAAVEYGLTSLAKLSARFSGQAALIQVSPHLHGLGLRGPLLCHTRPQHCRPILSAQCLAWGWRCQVSASEAASIRCMMWTLVAVMCVCPGQRSL